jgi:Skp family chaperone for outer membrane proteins
MKPRNIIAGCILVSIVLMTVAYDSNGKESKSQDTTLRIGAVRIRTVFKDCKKNGEHQKQLTAEQNRIIAELEKLSKEIEALKADLMTRKPDSSDHLDLTLQIMDKQAQLGARKEFYQQQIMLKDQRWTEQLYKEILEAVEQVAKTKGLDVVLAKEELDFPTESQTELMLAIRTHKLLYSADGLDITQDVVKLLNAEK